MYILFKITDSKGKVGKKNHLQQLPVIANYCFLLTEDSFSTAAFAA